MKRFFQVLSAVLVIGLISFLIPKIDFAYEEEVETVISKLEEIDSLQEMQDARKNYKASGKYSDATAENHKQKRAEYEQYLADMRKAREEAAAAYEALSEEDKKSIDPELVKKLDNNLDTVWNEISDTITPGVEDYQYQIVYPSYAYEFSNHMLSTDGGLHNEIPQTLILVDTSKNVGEWAPNGKYSFGTNNYEVVYCSDAENMAVDGTLYQRVNIEDSTYYGIEAAEHIRAIVSHSYPYLSVEQMKANLAAANFEYADQLTRSDIIAAVQMAIWNYSNGVELNGLQYNYSRTFDVNANSHWGKAVHDYTNELWNWWSVAKGHVTVDDEAGARVNALANYLMQLKGEKADSNQIVINEVKIEGAEPVQAKQDAYNVALKVVLNNGGTSEGDTIVINATTGSDTITKEVELGKVEYDMVIEAKAGETINVVVEGKQTLPKGAYLYMPQPVDETSPAREVSQVLVGVAEGVTNIQAKGSVTLDMPVTNPVTADLKLQKTDEAGKALTGVAFDLYFFGKEATYNIGTYPVNEKGELVIEKLLPGNYELVESVVSEGYVEPEKPIAFSIDEKGAITVADSTYAKMVDGVLVVENHSNIVSKIGSLTVKKVDSTTKEVLEDATFTLKGENYVKSLTTGKEGTVVFSDLVYGEYILTETKAPDGYEEVTTEWVIKVGEAEGEKLEWVQEVANTPLKSQISNDDTQIEPEKIPGLTVEKTVDKEEATVGEKVVYTITVKNTGDVELTNVLVKDEMVGLETTIDKLAVNEAKTLTKEYVITKDDIGNLENIATATIEVDDVEITQKASVNVEVSEKAEVVVEEKQETTNNPKTGVESISTALILSVFVLAGIGLGFYVYRRKFKA